MCMYETRRLSFPHTPSNKHSGLFSVYIRSLFILPYVVGQCHLLEMIYDSTSILIRMTFEWSQNRVITALWLENNVQDVYSHMIYPPLVNVCMLWSSQWLGSPMNIHDHSLAPWCSVGIKYNRMLTCISSKGTVGFNVYSQNIYLSNGFNVDWFPTIFHNGISDRIFVSSKCEWKLASHIWLTKLLLQYLCVFVLSCHYAWKEYS